MTVLDDEGLPVLVWHEHRVGTLTMRNLIVGILDAIDFRSLSREEQAVIVRLIGDRVGGRDFQRRAVRSIVRAYR
jgi:hypothetical protein